MRNSGKARHAAAGGKVEEHAPVQVTVIGGKPQRVFRGHRRDQVDPKPVAGGRHWGLAHRRPRGAGVVVRTHPRASAR